MASGDCIQEIIHLGQILSFEFNGNGGIRVFRVIFVLAPSSAVVLRFAVFGDRRGGIIIKCDDAIMVLDDAVVRSFQEIG